MEYREKDCVNLPHQLIMQDRTALELTGVTDVDNFDENVITCHTAQGILTVRGSNLRLFRLDIDGTSLSVEGRVDSLSYTDVTKGGLFGRLLR